MQKYIRVRGAREHNLKNIDVDIPREKLVVLTGVSGSGKTTLAFDTIFAEGQRRYVESLSAYARQFLGQMDKPDVDQISGLSPSISIDQKTTSKNPRSTVGTVTEIYDYLRLLYARAGTPHCPECGKEIVRQTVDQVLDRILSYPLGARLYIMAPVVRDRKGEFTKLFNDLKKQGFVRVRVDGEDFMLEEEIKLKKTHKHNISVIVDRLVSKEGMRSRLSDSVETAFQLAEGLLLVSYDHEELQVTGEELFSQHFACADCHISIPDPEPRMFSFNNPLGACPECLGLGQHVRIDPELVIDNPKASINEGAIRAGGWNLDDRNSWGRSFILALSKKYGIDLDCPFEKLPESAQNIVLYGNNGERLVVDTSNSKYNRGEDYITKWEGIIPSLERRSRESGNEGYEQYMSVTPCQTCHGARLRKESLAVKFGQKNIYDLTCLPIRQCGDFLAAETKTLSPSKMAIADQILRELKGRLNFLVDVGLDYLTLARASASLSGGEAQRIRLATQIGSGLMGVLYILDEPSIGLHQRDNQKLLGTLKQLRDIGNSVLVVEHDEETMREADVIVDLGPLAGEQGGELVGIGSASELMKNPRSLTGKYLSGELYIPIPTKRRKGSGKYLKIKGATKNNLKNIDVQIPLGTLTCITGVSGSGKSSLINGILLPKLEVDLNRARRKLDSFQDIVGQENLDKVIAIDQSPIGRTPRSNPATYTGLFDMIRQLYAQTPEARARAYKPGRFSFNVKGGRCEACRGDGVNRIEMHFLPDIYVPCEVCKGKRYNHDTLEVFYKGKNIADVLDMTIEEAVEFFANQPRLLKKVETLNEVGLGYLKLGQPSTQLSGGEAQRVKLATELSRRSTGKTLYILDEPTTGLHTADVHRLSYILDALTEGGNTVIVIEHNLDLIKTADYIIDLGPEGGEAGGEVVCSGKPEAVADCEKSYTGLFLKKLLP